MEGISNEALVEHEQLVETARQAKEAAHDLHESKQAEFAAACRVQQLKDDMEREQQKKEDFDALLAETERIEQNFERFSSLNTAIPWLENVYTERARLAAVRQEELEYREALATLEEELSKLQEQRKQVKCAYDAASGEETAVNERLKETEAHQRTLQQQAGQLTQIERLEARIQEAKVRMEPYRPILEAAANIEEEHGRQEALAQAVPLLKHLDAASNALTHYQTQLTEAEKNQTEAGLALIHKQTAVEHPQAAVDEASAQQDELQNKMVAHREQSRSLREKLEHRQALTGEEICPTCGSALDNEEVQARLASEREK
jgi:DNA repair exonuclease SbcCD ATPase subunit